MDIKFDTIPSLEESVDFTGNHQTVIERFYTPRYCINVSSINDDYCILIHSNRVCVLTLAPSHHLIKNNKTIDNINFQINSNTDRLSNKVSGKLKHGAQKLQPLTTLMIVNTTDRNSYKISSSITGKLIEINNKLIKTPNLMTEDPQNLGYLAIIIPDIATSDLYRKILLTYEQYEEQLKLEQ